jgi:hypothetical protein
MKEAYKRKKKGEEIEDDHSGNSSICDEFDNDDALDKGSDEEITNIESNIDDEDHDMDCDGGDE